MSYNLEFSRELLRLERQAAKSYAVDIPRGLAALCYGKQWFVQGKGGDTGMYVSADNAYHARALYIRAKIDTAHPQLRDEEVIYAHSDLECPGCLSGSADLRHHSSHCAFYKRGN